MPGILLLGGSGRLGSALRQGLAEVVAPSSAELNLRQTDSLARRIDEMEPEWVINCAGLTDVDGCERDPQAADELNGNAPGRLARRVARAGVRLLHVSTDYVFSGHPEARLAEDAKLEPINRYGQSKARGEGLVLDSGALALVARVQWLFGGPKSDFVRFVRQCLLADQEVPVVKDQIGVPSYTEDLAFQISLVIGRPMTGLLHLGNSGEVSREEQARAIAESLGRNGSFRSVTWDELGRPAQRPVRSVLDTTRMAALVAALPTLPGGQSGEEAEGLPCWQEAQDRYLAILAKESVHG
jgi:dTDP-4-dehydrorhamnose reductase